MKRNVDRPGHTNRIPRGRGSTHRHASRSEPSSRAVGPNPRCALVVMLVAPVIAGTVAVRAGAAEPAERIAAVGPQLTAVSSKIADPNWLVAWLMKPSRLRPGTTMPDFDMTAQEAQAIARFLYDKPPANASVKWQGGNPGEGEKLFVSRGCRGCHAADPKEAIVAGRVPNLADIGLKARGDWLFAWLRSPRAYDAHTPMPRLALSDEEIRHLVAFLLTRRAGADVVASFPRFDPNAGAGGEKLVEQYECAKCHELRGFPEPPPPFELAGGASPSRDDALRNGRILVSHYNCRGCHRIEGEGGDLIERFERKTFAPPSLEGAGARLQTSWLVGYLRKPSNLRPWLEMRMPDFGMSEAEARALARYFAALSNVEPVDEPVEKAAPEAVHRGLRAMGMYRCAQCHPTGALPAGVDREDLSIDLMLSRQRLRPSWVRKFLAAPKSIAGTQTRMPAVFYTTDGRPKVENPERQIADIAAYLLQMTEPLETALARLGGEEKAAEQKKPTDWSTYQY